MFASCKDEQNLIMIVMCNTHLRICLCANQNCLKTLKQLELLLNLEQNIENYGYVSLLAKLVLLRRV